MNFHMFGPVENDPEYTRALYASLTPAQLHAAEQAFARGKHSLHRMSESLMSDIKDREKAVGTIDDSVQFCMLAEMVGTLIMVDQRSFVMAVHMLAAAMFELARNERVTPDPLAHLEDETGDQK